MAWSTENWIQDDDYLSGYPSPAGTAYPETFSHDDFISIWHKGSRGYFIPSEDVSPFSLDGFDSVWLFNDKFNGYPHPAEFPPENPLNLMLGSVSVQCAYLGMELIWKRNGINKIAVGNLLQN